MTSNERGKAHSTTGDGMRDALEAIANAGIHATDHAMNTKHFMSAIALARTALAMSDAREAVADVDSTLWIAVSADNVPDLATLHVDEACCLQTMDEIGLMGFEPRRCTLAIHKQEGLVAGAEQDKPSSVCTPSSPVSPTPEERDALAQLMVRAHSALNSNLLANSLDGLAVRNLITDLAVAALKQAADVAGEEEGDGK